MTVLTFVNYYLPGSRGGGPIRSIANLVRHLGGEVEFRIVTTDRDFGDRRSYSDIVPGKWHRVGNADVLYMADKAMRLWHVRKLLSRTPCDVVYLNSFFHPRYSIQVLVLRYFGMVPDRPVVLAPRGELTAGALALKKWKKRLFLHLAGFIGLYDEVVWQASSIQEEREIRSIFGPRSTIVRAPVLVVPDLISPDATLSILTRALKAKGELRVAFLSRITRKKNLDGALRTLSLGLRGDVQFNIYGGVDDPTYWRECQQLMRSLPENIRVRYFGPIEHSDVASTLAKNDVFFLPTHGENFGHVVVEAMLAGCMVLISNRTPWHDLEEKGVGWTLPLEEPGSFADVLQEAIDMAPEEFARRSQRAVVYGMTVSRDPETLRRNRELFKVAQRRSTFNEGGRE